MDLRSTGIDSAALTLDGNT